MVADNAGSSGALSQFEQDIWDASGQTWLDFSQDGDRNAIYHSGTVHGHFPIAVNGAVLSNNKYCLNIDNMLAADPALFVNILGGPINSPDKYGAYITQNLGTVHTYHRGCKFDGGKDPSNDYNNFNTDAFEFSSGGGTFQSVFDCDMSNVSDGGVDAHGGCTSYVDASRFYRIMKMLRVWTNAQIIIANSTIDLSVDGEKFIWFYDTTGTVVSYNNTWIDENGISYSSIDDVPAGNFLLDGGSNRNQAVETLTDPFLADDFFIEARALGGPPPPDPPAKYPVLTMNEHNWTGFPDEFDYVWERDDVVILNEITRTYQTSALDQSAEVGCLLVARNAFGDSAPIYSSNTINISDWAYSADPLWSFVEFMTMFTRIPDGSDQFNDETGTHLITLDPAFASVQVEAGEGIGPLGGGYAVAGTFATIAAALALRPPLGPWCVEFFLTMGNSGTIVTDTAQPWWDFQNTPTQLWSSLFHKTPSNNGFQTLLSDDNISLTSESSGVNPTADVEAHVAFSVDVNELLTIYVQGAAALSSADISASLPCFDTGLDIAIGFSDSNNIKLIRGIRFTSGDPRYTAPFTPPIGFGRAF